MSSTDASDPRTDDGKRRPGIATAVIALALGAVGFVAGFSLRPEAEPREPAPVAEATTPMDQEIVIREFHKLYYRSAETTWSDTYWLGVPTLKCPPDLWVFQEILYETRPDWIIETGTFKGGSAFFMASLLDVIDNGHILTIDIEDHEDKPVHDRITYLLGSSTSEEIFEEVRARIQPGDTVMVVLDSNHAADHVLDELRLYGPLVTKGHYLVAEDTNINGHPVKPDFGPGPMEAVDAFLKEDDSFEIDSTREKFLLTFNPRGFLRKVR